jgi:hypothetical protein
MTDKRRKTNLQNGTIAEAPLTQKISQLFSRPDPVGAILSSICTKYRWQFSVLPWLDVMILLIGAMDKSFNRVAIIADHEAEVGLA